MKKPNPLFSRKEKPGALLFTGVILAFCAVIGLTVAIIAMLNPSQSSVPFSMDQLDAAVEEEVNLVPYLLPEFIGMRAGGEQKGAAAGENIVCELYEMVVPVLADALSSAPRASDGTEWQSALTEETFVYVRYHEPLAYQVIHAFSGGTGEHWEDPFSVYELLILPESGFRVVARSASGEVRAFEGTFEPYFTGEDLSTLMNSYRRSILAFTFSKAEGEPLFTERVRTRNILLSNGTLSLLPDREDDFALFLRLMDFNPDKLNTHVESETGVVYVEDHGVMRLSENVLEYAANPDGGVALAGSASPSLSDYLTAVCRILSDLREMSAFYLGGEASLFLTSAKSAGDGSLTLEFRYFFDNIRLANLEPALTVTFQNGAIFSLRLVSHMARTMGEQDYSYYEQWYYETAQANKPEGMLLRDVRLSYPADPSEPVLWAEWSAVYRREPIRMEMSFLP